MATLTYAESKNLTLDSLQANVSVDPAFLATEFLRHYNRAYAFIWEISGGSQKSVAGGTAWSPAPTATTTGKASGLLTDINEILQLWATTTSGSTGGGSGDVPLRRVELARIDYLRGIGSALGTYATPKEYAVSRMATATAADINKLALDVWPGVSGYYFPIKYKPQFTPLGGTDAEVPDLNDVFSRDLALVQAAEMAPLVGREELVPGIMNEMSQLTQAAMARKLASLTDAGQDT